MRERIFTGVLAAVMAVGLALFLIDPQARENPADEAAFQKMVEGALDSNSPSRFATWHAAHEQVLRLDPNRPAAAGAFVRSGLFHWYELSDIDRRSVILAIEPLLRDPSFFDSMVQPLFQLTGDFRVLRRANPGTPGALEKLMQMAVMHGRFDDYRQFREETRKRRFNAFQAERKTATTAEIILFVPLQPTAGDTPLLLGVLDALHAQPISNGQLDSRRVDALIDFAIDHDLTPIDGLEQAVQIAAAASDPERARLAVRLGQLDRAGDIEGTSAVADRARWHRYYIERAIAEMRRHESLQALQYLQKAGEGLDATLATEEIQRMAGNAKEAAAIHDTLVTHANKIQQWLGLCGSDICNHASGMLWSEGSPFALKLAAVQSDDVPAYAEVYADDVLRAEGPVSPALTMHADLLRGLRRIDIRLVNPTTRNAIHRRIRIE